MSWFDKVVKVTNTVVTSINKPVSGKFVEFEKKVTRNEQKLKELEKKYYRSAPEKKQKIDEFRSKVLQQRLHSRLLKRE